jgi:hypothetical protein
VLKEKSPRVSLAIAPPSSGGPAQSSLDLKEPDDQLVDSTLKYRDSNRDEDVRLFTDDTGPIGRAYEVGLDFFDLPAQWRRESGPSEEQKEIASLRQENEQLRANYASISVHPEFGGKRIEKIAIELPRYRPLEQMQVEELIKAAKARFPSKTAPGQGLTVYQLGNIELTARK